MTRDVSVSFLQVRPGFGKPAAFIAVVLMCLLAPACRTPAPAGPLRTPAPAQLTVINLTDYQWEIVIARATDEEVQRTTIGARGKWVAELPAGDYVVGQTALGGSVPTPLTRKVPVRFAPAQNYRWRLGTLLSETLASRQ